MIRRDLSVRDFHQIVLVEASDVSADQPNSTQMKSSFDAISFSRDFIKPITQSDGDVLRAVPIT